VSKTETITINGAKYDAHTGMRIRTTQNTGQSRASVHSSTVHAKNASTKTLKRSHVASPHQSSKTIQHPKTQRSPHITRFAKPSADSNKAKKSSLISDIGPIKHPVAARAAEKRNTKTVLHSTPHAAHLSRKAAAHHVATKKPAHHHTTELAHSPKPEVSSQTKKHSEIEKALKSAQPHTQKKRSLKERHPRLISISSASIAVVLLAGYFTYLNLPNLSVRVAGAQAGIAAAYPTYKPSGYSLNGPVAYNDGQVSMQFAANTGPQEFSVNQSNSTWDSSALLNNYVFGKSDGDYQTYNDNGLTIYIYGDNAAWVNGGILHTIEGDAPLSPDQIRKIATSM